MARTPVTFSIKHFFNSYVARTGNRHGLKSKQHKAILEATGEVAQEVLLKEGELKMFGRLGDLTVRKVKPKGDKKAPIDFGVYRSTGMNAYHFNDHSDGFIARILWYRKNCVMNDKHMWLFKPVRAFRRRLCDIMKNGSHEYLILTK